MDIKRLGIWMDHENAHVIEFSSDQTKTVSSDFNHEDRAHSLNRSEIQMHNKEQHQHAAYYGRLGDIILNYQEIILFGPTDAKKELLNFLRANHLFEKIKIDVAQTDKMTENQQHTFVKNHFSKKLMAVGPTHF
jgi:stalled ribosome rescue protein Dom34